MTQRTVKVLIMVSKFDHCLLNLLYRHHKGELDFEITAMVSNHLDLRAVAEREGIRFIYLPVTKDNKAQQEQELMKIVDETGTELVILARYMQILSDNLCRSYQDAPSTFTIHSCQVLKAKPYHQPLTVV
jgi:formyltetrahydrofolate deformylase